VAALEGERDREWPITLDVEGIPARAAARISKDGFVFTGHPHRDHSATWTAQNDAWERLKEGEQGSLRDRLPLRTATRRCRKRGSAVA
jgi:hypothetical protein